jgi:hypothetical protein
VKELTSIPIGAVCCSMELGAELCLEVLRQMSLLNKLVFSMCERALILKFTFSADLPVPTHFSLLFHLVLFDKVVSFLVTFEMFSRLLKGCHVVLLVGRL